MALVSLDDLKTYLGITDTSQDTKLTMLRNSADALIKRYCGQNFESATYTEFYDGTGTPVLILNQKPVQSITSLYLDNTGYFGDGTAAFAASTLLTAGSDYVLARDTNSATEESLSGVVYRINGSWDRPAARMRGLLSSVPGLSMGNIKVVYVAGYATVPADIQLAAMQMVATLKAHPVIGDVQQESYEDYSYSLADPKVSAAVIGSVASLLKTYKQFVI